MIQDELTHFSLSIIVGIIVGYFCHDFWAVGLALVGGFFIDGDHLIDYFINRGFKLNSADFFSGKHFVTSGKVYVFAHGFEYAIIFIALGFIFPNLGWLFLSLGFSNLLHLLYDTVMNGAVWPTYFISYRAAKNFDHNKLWT